MKTPYEFHYVQAGNVTDPPVLFLHGFLGSSHDWSDIITDIAQQHWSIAVDLPGHGKTVVNGSENNYRIENCADGLIHLLGTLGIQRCSVIGYSMGGRLALYLAVKFPDRFTRVVLESASPGLKTQKERKERREQDGRLAERLEKDSWEDFLKQWYDQPLFTTLKRDKKRFAVLLASRMDNEKRAPDWKSGLATSLRMMGVGTQPSLWDELHKIEARLCLIVGEKDGKFKRIAAEMVSRCPGTSIGIIENAGHNTHWENPGEFVRQVKHFLLDA
jgi:2-succinyl-6-hydroxy-2,4-cyclohexadiene-1-carboxylate synthase